MCSHKIFTFTPFKVTEDVGKLLGEKKVDAILCVAGGWAGGSAKAKCKLLIHECNQSHSACVLLGSAALFHTHLTR